MVLLIWGIYLMFALVPGALIGWLVGKIPIETVWCAVMLVVVAVAISVAFSMKFSNGPSFQFQVEVALVNYFPPFILPMFLGLWLARAKKQPQVRPWYLPPEN